MVSTSASFLNTSWTMSQGLSAAGGLGTLLCAPGGELFCQHTHQESHSDMRSLLVAPARIAASRFRMGVTTTDPGLLFCCSTHKT